MGAILRNTVFHYNIKKKDSDNDGGIEHASKTGNETNQEMQGFFNQIIFEQPLHNFPVYFVVMYIVCISIYVLLSIVYYRVFHPWRIIMGKKNSIQDGQSGDTPQQVNDEPLPEEENEEEEQEEEMSHL